jgi:hypothetical protein
LYGLSAEEWNKRAEEDAAIKAAEEWYALRRRE